MSTQLIKIEINKSDGLGTLECVGGQTYQCGGDPSFKYYPADSTIQPSDKKGTVYSREFVDSNNRPFEMKYSILWVGQKGVYIHQMGMLEGSHGCIHLLPGDAESVYNWVQKRTRILFKWK